MRFTESSMSIKRKFQIIKFPFSSTCFGKNIYFDSFFMDKVIIFWKSILVAEDTWNYIFCHGEQEELRSRFFLFLCHVCVQFVDEIYEAKGSLTVSLCNPLKCVFFRRRKQEFIGTHICRMFVCMSI